MSTFSFLPWVKNSLTRKATIRGTSQRPVLPVRIKLAVSGGGSATAEALRDVAVNGPGDVIGLQPEAILKTTPPAGEQQYPASLLASIEFGEEDLPWRYSPEEIPTTGQAGKQVNPWFFLLVLKDGEFTPITQGSAPLPGITVTDLATAFPAPDNRWAWAHMQTMQEVSSGTVQVKKFLEEDLKDNPDLAFSRVFSPRRLEAQAAYHAFLVPSYETGRLAGLGRPVASTVGAGWCAWASQQGYTPTDRNDFPVYYQWEFRTSEAVDFETLASRLRPEVLLEFGTQPLALTTPLSSASPSTPTSHQFVLDLPGVMQEVGAPVMETIVALQNDLKDTIQPVAPNPPPLRPIVTPPIYGRAYAPTTSLDPNSTDWLNQLNLHPAYRAMAAIGTQVVQDNQEEYMQRAWEQVHDIIVANMNLRGIQSGLNNTSTQRLRHLPFFLAGNGSTSFRAASGPAPSVDATADAPPAETKGTEPASKQGTASTEPAAYTLEGGAGEETGPLGMENYGLHLAGLALPRLLDPTTGRTLVETIRQSSTPLAAFSPTFRRLLKPFGRYQTSHTGRPRRPSLPPIELNPEEPATLLQADLSLPQLDTLLTLLAEGTISAAPPKHPYVLGYQFDDEVVQSLFEAGEPELWVLEGDEYNQVTDERYEQFMQAYQSFGQATLAPEAAEAAPQLDLPTLKEAVIEGTNPGPVFLARANRTVNFLAHYAPEEEDEGTVAPEFASRGGTAARLNAALPQLLPTVKPLMAYPVFKDPMGPVLQQRHPEMFLPNLENFPANAVTLLEYNRAFIEAYMLGLNHAMGSELLWRDYPTDLRGSYFRQFWDVSEFLHTNPPDPATTLAQQEEKYRDVRPLHQWGSRMLGTNPAAGAPEPFVLLAIRGDLLNRYPNTVVCAAPAITDDVTNKLIPDLGRAVYPLHRGMLGQDIILFSFALTIEQLRGDSSNADGHFFVLHERPGEPQFGLDYERADNQPFAKWDDFSWLPDLQGTPGVNITLQQLTTAGPINPTPPGVTPSPFYHITTSAEFAYATFQQPFLVAIQASEMMRPA